MSNIGRGSPAPNVSSQNPPLASSPASIRAARSLGTSAPRSDVTARLTSLVPPYSSSPAAQNGRRGSGRWSPSGALTPLAGGNAASARVAGPGVSALAAALSNSIGVSPPRLGTPPVRAVSPAVPDLAAAAALSTTPLTGAADSASGSGNTFTPTNYGSFESRQRYASTSGAYEDPEIVRRHLVLRSDAASMSDKPGFCAGGDGKGKQAMAVAEATDTDSVAGGVDDGEFSSLQLQGGDVTRPIYKWTEEVMNRAHRRQSFNVPRPEPESDVLDIQSIKVPGGFRRNYLRRAADQEHGDLESSSGHGHHYHHHYHHPSKPQQPRLFTASFLEFLSMYGHFAGEELEEDDEVLKPGEYFSSGEEGGSGASEAAWDSDALSASGSSSGGESDEERELLEDSTVLTPSRRRRRRKMRGGSGNASPMNAAAVLLKSFVGTGVLFLPRAYLNGGMLFSNLVLLFVAALSYYCFVLLVTTRLKVPGSFGDIGDILYGKWLRLLILGSIVFSQIGFVGAYIVFTSENLQAFILAVSKCKTLVPIKYLILMQMLFFLPFSLLRDISKLGITALVADAFIVIGLAYLFYYDVLTLDTYGLADIIYFNPRDWSLFIGTAIFTFEGIGLIIPIQESMRHPEKFPRVLLVVMVIITTLFTVMGAVSYAAYGSKTETVVLLNLPQDDRLVNGVQFLYSIAIMLSTPLQIFPAIRIMENGLFTRSGKYNPYIKWQKNIFRFFFVALCASIAWGGADNLDKFVALVGNFACIPLVYIYPPLLHYRGVARTTFWKISDIALCIFGFIAMAYTTSLTIMSWAQSSGPSLPGYCDSGSGNNSI